MNGTRIHFQWSSGFSVEGFRAGVSLHSHTLHSREPLDLLCRAAQRSWLLRALLRRAERMFLSAYGTPLDPARAWWTPPLSPLDAYTLESRQIQSLGLDPLVSLTDHDNIQGAVALQALDATRHAPVSIEWTLPIQQTFFHLGVHNLPPLRARTMVRWMQELTAKPSRAALREILAALHSAPEVLVVLNHPWWDEKGAGSEAHRAALLDLLGICGRYLHAIELNGLRPWTENQRAIQLGQAWSKPVVAGGDRHGLEPNVMVNLTSARNFAEFVAETRDGISTVMIGNRYRAAHGARICRNVIDILSTQENHALGWTQWSDRVFYRFDSGEVKSFAEMREAVHRLTACAAAPRNIVLRYICGLKTTRVSGARRIPVSAPAVPPFQ